MTNIKNDIRTLRFIQRRNSYLSVISLILIILGIHAVNTGYKNIGIILFIAWIIYIIATKIILDRKGEIHFHEEGVKVKTDFMSWEDISNIYIRAEKESINFLPTSELKEITLVSKSQKKLKLYFSFSWRMGIRGEDAFNRIYQSILAQTSERQWNEFITTLKDENLVDFDLFLIRPDRILFSKFIKGIKILHLDRIIEYYISNGALFIGYLNEKGNYKKQNLGPIALIRNIHILQNFLSIVVKSNKNINNN